MNEEIIKQYGERGDWFQTYTGRKFYPLAPRPEDVCVEDIAFSLAKVCRFGGHCQTFYSVLQHTNFSEELVRLWSEENPPFWLELCTHFEVPHLAQDGPSIKLFRRMVQLHDSEEGYTGDMIRPLKILIPRFVEIANGIKGSIMARFEIPYPFNHKVEALMKYIDNVALAVERRDLLLPTTDPWSTDRLLPVYVGPKVDFEDPNLVIHKFLKKFHELAN
jgi:hypothetical protein